MGYEIHMINKQLNYIIVKRLKILSQPRIAYNTPIPKKDICCDNILKTRINIIIHEFYEKINCWNVD